MKKGKDICKYLKEICRGIATENNIELDIPECTYEGDCKGTCPQCESELQHLEREINRRLQLGKAATITGLAVGMASCASTAKTQDMPPIEPLAGEPPIEIRFPESCHVNGTVLDADSGEPLMADILFKRDGKVINEFVADSNGNFSVVVTGGFYNIDFVSPGHLTRTLDFAIRHEEIDLGTIGLVRSVKESPEMMMGIIRELPEDVQREMDKQK